MNDTQMIILALDTLFQPTSMPNARAEALRLCESYKTNMNCAEIGFQLLSDPALASHVRYFGLQLIKHRVRHNWTDMPYTEQVGIKSHILTHVSTCNVTEVGYIKTGLAGVLTELVKHTWPQHWPNMLDEVIVANKLSPVGTIEVIEMMLLDLAEDVALLQNVSNKSRSKDLRQALTLSAPDIVAFLLDALRQQITALSSGSEEYTHVASTTLKTISAYAEWVKLENIFMGDGVLLEVIFGLLNNNTLQLASAECMLSIVNRKGQSERQKLLNLTTDFFIEKYAVAIKLASEKDGFDENKFLFLRCMGKVMATFTNLIITQWVEDDRNNIHRNLAQYQNFFQLLYFIVSHESRIIAQSVVISWCNLFRNKEIRKDETVMSMVPALLTLVSENLCRDFTMKSSFAEFEEMEINDHDELLTMLKLFNGGLVELLRFCTCTLPIPAVQACFTFAQRALSTDYSRIPEMHRTWEGLATFVETVMSAVILAAEDRGELQLLPCESSQQLFSTLQAMNCDDGIMYKVTLTCCANLFKLISKSRNATEYCKKLVDQVFNILDKTSEVKTNPDISQLRRQCCSVIIRSSKSYSSIMINFMDYMKEMIQARVQGEKMLSPFELCSMYEGLIIVSYEWKNFQRQNNLIRDIMATTDPIVKADFFQKAMSGPAEFAKSIGLCSVGDEQQSADVRSAMYYYIAITHGALSRSQVPEDQKEIESGGFIKNGIVVNPCYDLVGTAIDHVLTLTQLLSSIWSPEIRKLVHPDNLKALDIREGEKKMLVFVEMDKNAAKPNSEENPKSHWQKIQNFISLGLDNCFTVLGSTGKVLGPTFYKIPTLQHTISTKALGQVVHLPTLRLKCLLRQFLANFLKNCPLDLVHELTSPMLNIYCQFMMERLGVAWEKFGEKEEQRINIQEEEASRRNEEDQQEDEEILEEQLLRAITREHLDLLISLCINKTPKRNYDEENRSTSIGANHITQLTDLGAALAVSPACETILPCALSALAWHDTATCYKASQLLWPLLKTLLKVKENIFNPQITRSVFEAMLRGINRHGQHEGCESQLSSLMLMFIQALHDQHSNLFAMILLQIIPNANTSAVERFFGNFNNISEKNRKITFKKFLIGIIEQHVSQQFKEVPKMNILDPLQINRPRPKKSPEISGPLGLSELFVPST